jgi:DNA mismatch repair protein MutS
MTTPARRQYLDIKARHQDAILLYQIGDFFETFDEDAVLVARELQIVLTARAYGPDEQVPLAGVPIHALDTYAARLVAKGYTVAICEQVSPPGRGLVKREVTRILTPGTVADPAMLPTARDNLLAAVVCEGADGPSAAGLAYVDVATGAFACCAWAGPATAAALHAELRRLAPAEVLLRDTPAAAEPGVADDAPVPAPADTYRSTSCPAAYFDPAIARAALTRHFGVPSLAAFGCEERPLAVAAAGAIVAYLQRMNPTLLRLVTGLRTYDTSGFVEIDPRTWRTLEVVEPAHSSATSRADRHRHATLLSTLDATRTSMGARLLRRWLLQPLRERAPLEERLAAVAELHARQSTRERLAAALDGLSDVERLIGRVVHGTATPRELHGLRLSLARVPALAAALHGVTATALRAVRDTLDPCEEMQGVIASAVNDPTGMESGTIRAGYDAELDGLVASIAEARAWIAGLEATERERSGIRSLKVGYNKVFGYYIEVSRPNLERVPPDYIRKQTIAGGERYVTADLKEREALVLHAEERIAAREATLYADVLARLATHQARPRRTAEALAQADVLLALAEVALARGYTRPELDDSTTLEIVGGRHPIVEHTLDGEAFIANDTRMHTMNTVAEGETGPALLLLTGPNMAGKSTYLRQVACIVLLAQIGSFVPARHARIGLVDRIFTRVGAEDDLARGLSTFMLEMVETSYILRHATPRSLIILDEVGRGTSTRDGLAIARAVLEHLHDRIGARTLFATHYHELADATAHLPRLRALQMAVSERDGEAVFLHRIVPGASSHSYGLQVARMAGVPAAVLDRAADLLAAAPAPATNGTHALAETHAAYAPADGRNADGDGLAAHHHQHDRELTLALAGLNIAAMTPLDALNLLFSLQQRALAALHAVARERQS